MNLESESTIQRFLASLDHNQREGFLSYVESTDSIYEIWLYASVLGYEETFRSLEQWVQRHYPKLNKRKLLLSEIVKLEADIEMLRQQVFSDLVKPEAAATRIAHLSKEMRGHLVEVDRMTKAIDRRGLVMAGADKVMRELRLIFRGNDEIINALDLACESVWAQMTEEK